VSGTALAIPKTGGVLVSRFLPRRGLDRRILTAPALCLAAREVYAAIGAFPELLSIYHLFGDPALRIKP
jgi:hypothetical protein